jgi:hypothetical protein
MALSQSVNATGVDPASGQSPTTLASAIVKENQPVINRFVAVQRQQVEIGGMDIQRAVLPLPGMDVYYRNVHGLERMHYNISPQAEGPRPPPEVPKAPEPPPPAAPPDAPVIELPEIEVRAPEIPEIEIPEAPKLEEEKEQPKLESPEFLLIDIPCFLAVEFGDGAGDPPSSRG